MDESLQVQLALMRSEIQASAIPDDNKETALWCLGQLPGLYSQFRLTNENRYGEKIVGLVRGVLTELAKGKVVQAEAQKRPPSILERLQQIHEEFGLPGLTFRLPGKSAPRSPKLKASR